MPLLINIDVTHGPDTKNTVRLQIICTIHRSCLKELDLIVSHAPHTLHFRCFNSKQVLPIIDITYSIERACNSQHIMLHIISFNYIIMQSFRLLRKSFPRYLQNIFFIPHCHLLKASQFCMHKRSVVTANIHFSPKVFERKIPIRACGCLIRDFLIVTPAFLEFPASSVSISIVAKRLRQFSNHYNTGSTFPCLIVIGP